MSPLTEPTRLTLAKGQPVPNDPNFAFNSLLLHGNGTNGSTVITDSSGSPKAVAAVGNAQISTAQSKFGGSSIAFDGNGDYLTVPNTPAWDLGTGDFTIEAWVYIVANTPPDGGGTRNAVIVANYPASTLNVPCYALAILGDAATTGTGIVFTNRDSSTGYSISATIALAKNTWYHVAVARSGTTTRLFVDGSLLSSGTLGNQTVTSVNPLLVGRLGFAGFEQELNGHIDDLRITKGVARYTSNFTPPTLPFPDF